MPTRADLASAALALAVHAAAGYALLRAPPRAAPRAAPVEVDIRERRSAPEPPRLTPPERPAETPAPEPARARPRTRLFASPAPTRASPPPRVFGFTMDSAATDGSGASVPAGNTTAMDPAESAPHRGPVAPVPASRAGRTATAGPLSIREPPDIDTDACGRSVSYPKKAQALGIEGAVRLRVSLDERGVVVEAKVLSGLGHGLDGAAVDAILHHCKFTPAIGTDGRPVAYVIDPYVFRFEIPR